MSEDQPNATKPAGALTRIDATGVPLLIARLIIGGMFVYLSILKIQEPQAFLKAMKEFDVLPLDPPRLINTIAVLLPWFELVAGIAILLGVMLRGAGLAIFFSLVVFTIAVAARAFGIHSAEDIAFCAIKFDCGCGSGEVYICSKIVQNIGLTLASLPIFLSRSRRFCLGKLRSLSS